MYMGLKQLRKDGYQISSISEVWKGKHIYDALL